MTTEVGDEQVCCGRAVKSETLCLSLLICKMDIIVVPESWRICRMTQLLVRSECCTERLLAVTLCMGRRAGLKRWK